jgi:hypothetical protein
MIDGLIAGTVMGHDEGHIDRLIGNVGHEVPFWAFIVFDLLLARGSQERAAIGRAIGVVWVLVKALKAVRVSGNANTMDIEWEEGGMEGIELGEVLMHSVVICGNESCSLFGQRYKAFQIRNSPRGMQDNKFDIREGNYQI